MARLNKNEKDRRQKAWKDAQKQHKDTLARIASGKPDPRTGIVPTGAWLIDPVTAALNRKDNLRRSIDLLKEHVSAPFADLVEKERTLSKEAFAVACKHLLIRLWGYQLNELERKIGRQWLRRYLLSNETQEENKRQQRRALGYNNIAEHFDRRGETQEDAYKFIAKTFREDFDEKDVNYDAVEGFLRRAEKGSYGKPIPRYKPKYTRLELHDEAKHRRIERQRIRYTRLHDPDDVSSEQN